MCLPYTQCFLHESQTVKQQQIFSHRDLYIKNKKKIEEERKTKNVSLN